MTNLPGLVTRVFRRVASGSFTQPFSIGSRGLRVRFGSAHPGSSAAMDGANTKRLVCAREQCDSEPSQGKSRDVVVMSVTSCNRLRRLAGEAS